MLRYLVGRGVFAEPKPGQFALTSSAEQLLDDHADGRRAWLDLTGAAGRADLAFGALLDVVRTGQPGCPVVHARGLWEDLAADPALDASFDALMAGNRESRAPALAALDWSSSRHVADVGGGNGVLLVSLLRAHPGLCGTLVELPATAAAAEAAGPGGVVRLGELIATGEEDRQMTHIDMRMLAYLGGGSAASTGLHRSLQPPGSRSPR